MGLCPRLEPASTHTPSARNRGHHHSPPVHHTFGSSSEVCMQLRPSLQQLAVVAKINAQSEATGQKDRSVLLPKCTRRDDSDSCADRAPIRQLIHNLSLTGPLVRLA